MSIWEKSAFPLHSEGVMNIAMIAAIGKNRELGRNNDLIWHFKEDMRFFRETTKGATVIMGRKTFESLPKALPGRRNIVISSNTAYRAEGTLVVPDIESALESAEKDKKIFIIGGARIYQAFLPYAKQLYLTEIDAACEDADTFFPAFDTARYHREVLKSIETDNTKLSFVLYTNKTL